MEDGCMGRQARKSGKSNIYHVMLRGINRQEIFEDQQDEDKFLTLLDEYKLRCGFAVYGYCLMNNHVHLLLHGARNPCIRRIGDAEVELGPGESSIVPQKFSTYTRIVDSGILCGTCILKMS